MLIHAQQYHEHGSKLKSILEDDLIANMII